MPLDGEATYGGWTWRTARVTTPEGEAAWQMCLDERVLYTFTDEPRHPVDYLAPNHWSSTHPTSVFTGPPIAQRSDDDVQVSLVGLTLTERFPDGGERVTTVPPDELAPLLATRFGLEVDAAEAASLVAAVPAC